MKKIYIAHPLLGDMDRKKTNLSIPFDNMNKVDRICRAVVEAHDDILPLSPIHMFSFFNIFERERPLTCCMAVLEMADELWVFGDWQASEGCKMEISFAEAAGIKIVFMSESPLADA
jgi:hypothetical protein